MKQLIENYRGSVAFVMAGRGPKPVLAPPDDLGGGGGGGDDKSGDDKNGGEDDAGGDKGGAGGDDKGGGKLAGKGLFAKRSGDGGDGGDDKGAGGDDDGKGEDGRPKGLADKFWNAKDKAVNVAALSQAYADLEKAHGELKRQKGPAGGEVPENADGYFSAGIAVPEEAANFKGLDADDPGVKSWAEVCKEEGLGKDIATRLMSKMLVKMNDHALPPLDPDEEMKALGKNATATVDGVFVWVEGLEKTGQLSEDDIDVITGLSQTANGIRLLAKFRNMAGEKPIPVDPGGNVRGMSMEQLDDAYKEAVKKGDYKEQERLDELRNRMNPEGAGA